MDKLQGGTSWSTCLEISDDSFLESETTMNVTPGNLDEYARNRALTDTAATMYRLALVNDSEELQREVIAVLDDLLDSDDSSNVDIGDDEGSFDQAMRAVKRWNFTFLTDDRSHDDTDASELSPGFDERLDVRMVGLTNLKRKRDEFESGAKSGLLMQNGGRQEYLGRAGISVEFPMVIEDDTVGDSTLAGDALDCIVLSDSDSDEGDSESDDESGAPTVPVWRADNESMFGWFD